MTVFDIGDPASIQWLDSIPGSLGGESWVEDVRLCNGTVYVAANDMGLLLYRDQWSGAPSVGAQPQAVAARPGQRISLCVETQGAWPLEFQWFKDGAPMGKSERWSGQDAPVLTIHDVRDDLAGRYHMTVRNAMGSATSEEAKVSLMPVLHLEIAFLPSSGEAFISFMTEVDGQYSLETTHDLANWAVVESFLGTGSTVSTRQPFAGESQPAFFRLRRN